MDLSLRTMEYLVTVVDEGHFGRAATALHVSAPALSKQIRKFEDQLQLALLDRSVHPVRPTEEGIEIINAARAVVAAADHTRAVARAASRRNSGRLRLGFVLAFAGPLTRAILDGLAAAEPDVEVDLVEVDLGDQIDAVVRQSVDASFIRAPFRTDDRVQLDHVLDEPRVVALPATHPLPTRTDVSITDLTHEPCLRYDDGLVDNAFSRWWAVDPRPDGSGPTYSPTGHTITEFSEHVAAGRAIFFTTRSLAEQINRPDISFVPVADIPDSKAFLCTRTRDRSRGVAALRHITRQVATTRL